MGLFLTLVVDLQAALKLSGQAEVTLQKELQRLKSTASSQASAAKQAASAAQAELSSLTQQLSVSRLEAQALREREEDARSQSKQLTAALTAAQVDYQV